MIKKMLIETKRYLPLKILEVWYEKDEFQISGLKWKFRTLGAWRVSENDKMVFGCYDSNSEEVVYSLKDLEIIDIDIQTDLLKIDPVFILSNGQKIEIFSINTYDLWTFNVDGVEFYGESQC